MRTPDEIRAAGAAWVTEAELDVLCARVSALEQVAEAARAFLASERYVPGYPAELRLRKALAAFDKQEPRT